jgi:hypothetical protein
MISNGQIEFSDIIEITRQEEHFFSYCGKVDRTLLNAVLKVVKNRMQFFKENPKIVNRVYNAINETVENFIIHCEQEHWNMNHKMLLVVLNSDDGWRVITGNHINENQRVGLEAKLKFINTLSLEEKKLLFNGTMKNSTFSERDTAGLGLIDIAIKSDLLEFEFQKRNDQLFYILNILINR